MEKIRMLYYKVTGKAEKEVIYFRACLGLTAHEKPFSDAL